MTEYSYDFLGFCKMVKNNNEIRNITNLLKEHKLLDDCNAILDRIYNNKGVFTVLVTLLFYKMHHPEQDIRLHRTKLVYSTKPNKKGFSGRSFDSKHITPILK